MTVAADVFRFEDSYARAVPGLSVPWTAAEAPAPELLVLNEELAAELGVDPAALREPPGVALLAGRGPEGVTTVAQAYAGHQFGMYSPRLGDDSEAAVEAAPEVLNGFASAYDHHWAEGMAAKLGLAAPDRDLAKDILKLMRVQKVDST
jgi:uncharacterized protein YdiU (UPF0061 family)